MSADEKKRGGPGRGQGRKHIAEGEKTVTICAKVTEAQRDKYHRLGASEWWRDRIDKAKEPPAT